MAKRVFIGVGHGGSDPGAVKYVTEKTANLTIALELKRLLEAAGVTVGISRTKDEDDPITEEIKEANAFKPDLAIDVHNNAGGGDGFEVLVQTNGYSTKSRAAAQAIEAQVKAIGQGSRGLKTRLNSAGTDYFGFLRQVAAPAIIVEGFFVDNAKDAADFDTADEQKKLAQAYAKGILDYFDLPSAPAASTEPDPEPVKPSTVKPEPAQRFDKTKAGSYKVTAKSGLNLRTGAGVGKTIIKVLPYGSTVRCYGYFTGVWLYVAASTGEVGFIHSSYVTRA
ncbi:MAG: N-acetylmuramoyl-L-alanine amidase [Faecousia sp.]